MKNEPTSEQILDYFTAHPADFAAFYRQIAIAVATDYAKKHDIALPSKPL